MKKIITVFGCILISTLCLKATAQEVDKTQLIPIKKPVLHAYCSSLDTINKMKPIADVSANPEPTMILISKAKSRMYLMQGDKVLRKYRVAFGSNYNDGPKVQEGDRKTPEGIYYITERKENSQYHRALRISYPNDYDKEYAAALGVKPGGDIMIHGLPTKLEGFLDHPWIQSAVNTLNWTAGCAAITNDQMDIMFITVPLNTEVAICP